MDIKLSLKELPSKMDMDDIDKLFETFKKLSSKKTGLYAIKIRKLMESLTPCKLEEIGTIKWLKKMNKLMLIVSAVELDRDKFTKDLIETNKITVIIHDMVMIALWLSDIKPQLLTVIKEKMESGYQNWEFCTPTASLIIKHYERCVWIISTVLHDREAVRQLGPDALDVTVFAMCTLKKLLVEARLITKFKAIVPSIDPKASKKADIGFNKICEMAMTGIMCLIHLVENLDTLSTEAVTQLLHPETKLIATVVDLIDEQPWCCSKKISDQLENWTERPETVPRDTGFIETNWRIGDIAFEVLHELLVVQSKKVPAILDFTLESYERLMELLVPLTNYPDIVAMRFGLSEIKLFLEQLRQQPPPCVHVTSGDNSSSQPPLPPAPYHTSIQAEIPEKKEAIINAHVANNTFITSGTEEMLDRLNRYHKCFMEDMNHNCFKCGEPDADSKCSRCGYAYYCNRKCQSKDWKNHKQACRPKQPEEVKVTYVP